MCCRSGRRRRRRHVRGSNMTFIGVAKDRVPGRAIVISALDNLVKGASGQAVQNMNLMLGYPETMGLEQIALFPRRLRAAAGRRPVRLYHSEDRQHQHHLGDPATGEGQRAQHWDAGGIDHDVN